MPALAATGITAAATTARAILFSFIEVLQRIGSF